MAASHSLNSCLPSSGGPTSKSSSRRSTRFVGWLVAALGQQWGLSVDCWLAQANESENKEDNSKAEASAAAPAKAE